VSGIIQMLAKDECSTSRKQCTGVCAGKSAKRLENPKTSSSLVYIQMLFKTYVLLLVNNVRMLENLRSVRKVQTEQ
jgi:hypothetical protein